MKALIIGLGSMGKRRIRNLQAIGGIEIHGVDLREDRRQEVIQRYGIFVHKELPDLEQYDAIIISTPPDYHLPFIQKSLDTKVSCFVEASVILQGLPELLQHHNFNKVVVAPSCTMRFHPAVKQIKQLISTGQFGQVTSFTFHSGQYLPDWHPWERITDFYVGQKETGGCREIIPFELTWLVNVLGFPQKVIGSNLKTGLLPEVDIDDVYAIILEYPHFIGSLTVDVTSRFATRSLILNLEQAQIRWSWETKYVWVYDAINQREIVYHEPQGKAQSGYNENIIEGMYIEEMRHFLDAVKGGVPFPNTLADDIKVLHLMHQTEAS